MKIALVQPFVNDGNIIPPLGLLYIGALLEKNGFEVKIFDERFNNFVEKKVLEFKPDIVGISVVTSAVPRGLEFARYVKKKLNCVVVFGGPHVTAMPKELLNYKFVDYVIVFEGEYPMLELCTILKDKKLKKLNTVENLYYKKHNKIVHNKFAEFLSSEELDKLPFPAYHLIEIEDVFGKQKHGLFQKGKRILSVMSSRGCPNRCTFCCRVMGEQFRFRSPENVLKEIKYIIKKYNLDEIFFEDDNFTLDKRRAIKILNEIIKMKLNIYIKFANGIRADQVDYEMLKKLKEAGCYWIGFGIESGSENTLKLMKKNLSLEKVRENVKLAKSLGFLVGGNCIIGYPGETKDDIKKSLDFFKELKLDSSAIVNLVPFPETEVREICEKNNYLTNEAKNWKNYLFGIYNCIPLIETEEFSAKEIKSIVKKFYWSLYLSPRNILTILKNISLIEIYEKTKSFIKSR